MDKVFFKLDIESLTFDELIAIQENSLGLREVKVLLARYATDSDGEPLPEAEANTALGSMTLRQMKETFAAFGEQLKAEMAATLPNATGKK